MLKQQSGKIINISSVAGLGGCGLSLMQPVYALAKGAVVNFTREVATEYGRYGNNMQLYLPRSVPYSKSGYRVTLKAIR